MFRTFSVGRLDISLELNRRSFGLGFVVFVSTAYVGADIHLTFLNIGFTYDRDNR